jgi:FtsH-binding integral membrane protein
MSQPSPVKLSTSSGKWIVAISVVLIVAAIVQVIVGMNSIAALTGAVGVLFLVLGLRQWKLIKRAQLLLDEESALR